MVTSTSSQTSAAQSFVSQFGGTVSPATQRARAFTKTFGSGSRGSSSQYRSELEKERAMQEEILRKKDAETQALAQKRIKEAREKVIAEQKAKQIAIERQAVQQRKEIIARRELEAREQQGIISPATEKKQLEDKGFASLPEQFQPRYGSAFGEKAGKKIKIPNVFGRLPESVQPRRGTAFEKGVGEKITPEEIITGTVTAPFRTIGEVSKVSGGIAEGGFSLTEKLPEGLQLRKGVAFERGAGEKITAKEVGRVAEVATEQALFFKGGELLFKSPRLFTKTKPTEVIFKGASQRAESGLIQTDIVFKTSTKDMGVARGFTLQEQGRTGLTKSVTIGKVKTVGGREFTGAEQSLTQQEGKLFAQLSRGTITDSSGNKIKPFVGAGVGIVEKDTSLFLGGVKSSRDTSRLLGKIRELPSEKDIFKVTGSLGKPSVTTKQISAPAEQSLQKIVGAGISGETSKISSLTPKLSSGITTPGIGIIKTKQISTPTTVSKIITKENLASPKIEKSLLQTGRLSQGARTKQDTKLKTSQITKERLKTNQRLKSQVTQVETQRQRLSVLQKSGMQQKARQQLKTPSILSPPVIPKEPTVPKIPKQKTPKESFSTGSLFGVSVRRKGKFKSIAKGLTLKQATEVGREKVAGTLAATFRIEGNGKDIGTPTGFRRKETKEGTLFIERRGLRLSRKGETQEILSARRSKL
jgi:hypothetical protein